MKKVPLSRAHSFTIFGAVKFPQEKIAKTNEFSIFSGMFVYMTGGVKESEKVHDVTGPLTS